MGKIRAKTETENPRRSSREMVFSCIHRQGRIARVEIARQTGISLMSVGRIADDLIRLGIVTEQESGDESTGVGRHPKLLSVDSNRFLSVGVAIDRDGISGGILNFEGQVLKRAGIARNLTGESPEQVLRQVAEVIRRLRGEGRDMPLIQTVGVVCPGLIDPAQGIVHFSSQFQWHDVPAVRLLEELTGETDIVLDNEVKARAIAEDLFGQGKNFSRSVVLHIGSGIGSSVMIDHRLYRGRQNMAGEIGHVCINPTGNMCECGRRGCLQTYIADWAILKEAGAVQQGITLEEVFEAYQAGKSWAVNLIDRAVDYVSITISMLANTYAPDEVILCGSMIEKYELFRRLVVQNYKKELNDYVLHSFELRVSGFANDGTIISAATMAYYRMLMHLI